MTIADNSTADNSTADNSTSPKTDIEAPVLVVHHQGWAEIILNRPAQRNSVIPPLSDGVRTALAELAAQDSVACVVLRGAGGFFCSGVDLKALQADPPPPWLTRQFASWRDLHLALYHFPKPVIGALEKYAINAGSALALACDVLIAGTTAFLQVGEIQQGAMMPMNAAWFKLKSSEQVMARMALLGDRVAGPELLRLGLVTEVVADELVVCRCHEIASRIAGFPQGAGTNIKKSMIIQRQVADAETFFQQAGGNTALLTAGMLKE
ncbi:MAG: enoyl-CoA hydratase/isomerase family protein [Pseudomonadales bacterium]|nr:enoyl-CoA hydratase/isomerase family protein [Pseudomonadales bacterium]